MLWELVKANYHRLQIDPSEIYAGNSRFQDQS